MPLQKHRTRRQVAGSVTTLVGVILAGCSSRPQALDGPPTEDTPIDETCEREHQELPDLVVKNEDSERHTVELTISGERGDGSSEPFFEDTYDLEAGSETAWGVVFDPDAEAIERFDDLVATVSTEDGRTDTEGVHATVIGLPLRYSLEVRIDSSGAIHAEEIHVDTGSEWDPAC